MAITSPPSERLRALADARSEPEANDRRCALSRTDWYVEGVEFGSCTIRIDLETTYGQFNRLRHCGRGVVHGSSA